MPAAALRQEAACFCCASALVPSVAPCIVFMRLFPLTEPSWAPLDRISQSLGSKPTSVAASRGRYPVGARTDQRVLTEHRERSPILVVSRHRGQADNASRGPPPPLKSGLGTRRGAGGLTRPPATSLPPVLARCAQRVSCPVSRPRGVAPCPVEKDQLHRVLKA